MKNYLEAIFLNTAMKNSGELKYLNAYTHI
jgi:hypothetical protein